MQPDRTLLETFSEAPDTLRAEILAGLAVARTMSLYAQSRLCNQIDRAVRWLVETANATASNAACIAIEASRGRALEMDRGGEVEMLLRASLRITLLVAALYALPLAAQHSVPSKPFLERTGFLLESAGFRARFANDDATRRALHALPPHKFVVHNAGGEVRYIYADPGACNCIFTGTRENWLSYRDMLGNPVAGVDDVAPDYKTQASALLANDPVRAETLANPGMLDGYFNDFR